MNHHNRPYDDQRKGVLTIAMYSENKRYCMVPLWSGSLLRAVSPGSKREYSRVTLLVIQPANEFNCRVKVNGHVTLVTVPVVHAYRT